MSFGSSYLTLPDFKYVNPKSLQETLRVLDEHKGEAKILAGGVGLFAFMKERLVAPEYVVDIKGISELQALRDEGSNGLVVGAAVNLNRLLELEPLKDRYKALRDCIRLLGDPVLRNRSTLMGDLCEALPYLDAPTPLLIFDAEVEAASVRGRRRIPVSEFIKGVAETALEPNELAVSVHLKAPPENSRSVFLKHTSNVEFSITNVAALCANPSRPEARIMRYACGAITPTAARVHEVEELFKRKAPIAQLIDEAIKVIGRTVEPMTDVLAKAEYRSHMLEILSIKAFHDLLGS